MLIGLSSQGEQDGQGMQHTWRGEKGKDHSEELGVDRKIILQKTSGKVVGRVWIGCIWLRMSTGDRLLCKGN
jgi:hypothetical protein